MNQTLLRRLEINDQTLQVIYIWSERELRDFITAVPGNSNIRTLSIRDTVLAPEVATALSAILPKMPFLDTFDVVNCDCSIADVLSILAAALASRDSLEYLSLTHCRIDIRGAEIITSSLGDNTTLKKLILSGNSIGDEGAIAFASLLSDNSSIRYVDLQSNIIGADGMSALAGSLRSVERIRLEDNVAKPNTQFKRVLYNNASIESVIASNHTLKTISPRTADLQLLLELNAYGPEKAVQAKITRFLDERPTFVLTTGMEVKVMPFYMERIGKDCRLNTMFELIRDVPGLLENHRRRPEQQSHKRSRS